MSRLKQLAALLFAALLLVGAGGSVVARILSFTDGAQALGAKGTTTGDLLCYNSGANTWGRCSVASSGGLGDPGSNGLVARTATGTTAARTLTAPAAGISVSNGTGVSGNPTLALADDLAGLEGLSATSCLAERTTGGAAGWDCLSPANALSFVGAAKSPVSSASAPAVTDDEGDGYGVGQIWCKTSATRLCYVLKDATAGAADWGALLSAVTSYEIRLTGGLWFAYPQVWTGAAWVDSGAGIAGTIEVSTDWTAEGTDLTILSGTTNTTQPHAATGKVYWAVADLTTWASNIGAVYALEMSAPTMTLTGGNARVGVAMTSAAGSFDSSGENLATLRGGMNTSDSHYILTAVVGTGSFGAALYDSATLPTGQRMMVAHRQAVAFAQAHGGSDVASTHTPPTTTATRLYVYFTAGATLTDNVVFADWRARVVVGSRSP